MWLWWPLGKQAHDCARRTSVEGQRATLTLTLMEQTDLCRLWQCGLPALYLLYYSNCQFESCISRLWHCTHLAVNSLHHACSNSWREWVISNTDQTEGALDKSAVNLDRWNSVISVLSLVYCLEPSTNEGEEETGENHGWHAPENATCVLKPGSSSCSQEVSLCPSSDDWGWHAKHKLKLFGLALTQR